MYRSEVESFRKTEDLLRCRVANEWNTDIMADETIIHESLIQMLRSENVPEKVWTLNLSKRSHKIILFSEWKIFLWLRKKTELDNNEMTISFKKFYDKWKESVIVVATVVALSLLTLGSVQLFILLFTGHWSYYNE
jgi:hypothetical protein